MLRPRYTRRARTDPLVIGVAAAIVVGAAAIVAGIPVLAARRVPGGREKQQAAPSVLVSVTPTSAAITLGKLSGIGELKIPSVEPGAVPLRVTRNGFEPIVATLTVTRGKSLVVRYALKPLPQQVSIAAHPARARVTLGTGSGAKTVTGRFRASLPAGPLTVTVEAPGYAALRRDVFLDAPLTLDLWLDPIGQLVRTVSAFRCVPAPKGVAVTPDGSQMWVTALVTQPSIEAYDRSGRVIGKVDLGKSGAVEVVFSADGTKAYASQMQSASVFEIDTKTYSVLRKFGTNSSWTKVVALSPDGKTLYAANWSGDDVSVIDLASGKCVRRFPTVDTPRGLWPTADGKQLWVAGFGEQSHVGRIAVIDLATGKSRLLFSQQGGAMRHMVADEKRGVMFTSDMGKAVVWATDMRTGKTTRFAKTDSHPNTIDLSPDGRFLVVSCRGANDPKSYYVPGPEWGSILLFDAVSGRPLDAIVGGNQCTALDLSADGRTLVFSDFLDNRLHVYDVPEHAILAAGKGGRFEAHKREIRKPGWGAGSGGSGGGD
jgi:YVTN family beta-propeller protein